MSFIRYSRVHILHFAENLVHIKNKISEKLSFDRILLEFSGNFAWVLKKNEFWCTWVLKNQPKKAWNMSRKFMTENLRIELARWWRVHFYIPVFYPARPCGDRQTSTDSRYEPAHTVRILGCSKMLNRISKQSKGCKTDHPETIYL